MCESHHLAGLSATLAEGGEVDWLAPFRSQIVLWWLSMPRSLSFGVLLLLESACFWLTWRDREVIPNKGARRGAAWSFVALAVIGLVRTIFGSNGLLDIVIPGVNFLLLVLLLSSGFRPALLFYFEDPDMLDAPSIRRRAAWRVFWAFVAAVIFYMVVMAANWDW